MQKPSVVVIGAGPAGLSAAYEVARLGGKPVVLEAAGMVGGISRTEIHKGYHFDVGGHRFFTKNKMILRLWEEMLDDDFSEVKRKSRIYHGDRFFDYPLRPANTLFNLGMIESLRILASYAKARIAPLPEENTFEQWVCNRFGKRLYRIFFKTYTEKVWGIPCHEIRADWAAQRIKGLSMITAVSNALFNGGKAKSLVETFRYPARGSGMMWERFHNTVENMGGRVLLNARVVRLAHENGKIVSASHVRNGVRDTMPVGRLISCMPVTELVETLRPKAPENVLEAARALSHRAFVMVALILDKPDVFPDQWIYVHRPDVKVGRIQNFKNWSRAMVPDSETTSLGMEYFCTEGDEFWKTPDKALIDLAGRELEKLGLAGADNVVDGFVLRQPKAYPIYDSGYKNRLKTVREYIETFENLQTTGRNGMHRYNNQDHSMLTGIMAARNIFGASHDPWEVNEEDVYLEEDRESLRQKRQLIIRAFARMDRTALGTATGTVSGLLLLFATLWPIVMGNQTIKPFLSLLGQYFIGYAVTVKGAFVGMCYGFVWGFFLGWSVAGLRNLFLALYVYRIKRQAEKRSLKDFLDHF